MYQWYLLVWIFAVGFMTYLFGQMRTVEISGQRETRYGWIPVLATVVPLIYFAGTRDDMGGFGDTYAYRIAFRDMPSSLNGLSDYFTDDSKDRGFTYFSVFIKSFVGNNDVMYFTIIAAISLLCIFFVYKNYSCNFMMTAFLFVASGDYIQWNYNGIRQFLAISLIFACSGLLLKKKYVPLIVVILLAATIHASVLLMIPIIFIVQGRPFNKRTIAFLVAMILAIAFIDRFTNIVTYIMENTQYSGEVNQYLSTEGTSMQRVLVYSIPAIIAFVFRRRIEFAGNKMINIAVNMSVATMGLYLISAFSSGQILGRVPALVQFYNYILLPWEVDNIFTKNSAKTLYILMIIGYLVYYYYQTSITWGLV